MFAAALHITAAVLRQVQAHAERVYPLEACGFLLGGRELDGLAARDGQARDAQARDGQRARDAMRITRAHPTRNAHPAPRDHYAIPPADVVDAAEIASAAGLELVGAYHSHPEGDAAPSAVDLHDARAIWASESWPYLIVAVRGGRAGACRSFVLRERTFHLQDMTIDTAAAQCAAGKPTS